MESQFERRVEAVSIQWSYWHSHFVRKPGTIVIIFDLDALLSFDFLSAMRGRSQQMPSYNRRPSLICSSEHLLSTREELAPAVIDSLAHCTGASIGCHRAVGVGWKLITGSEICARLILSSGKLNCGGSGD